MYVYPYISTRLTEYICIQIHMCVFIYVYFFLYIRIQICRYIYVGVGMYIYSEGVYNMIYTYLCLYMDL